MALDRRRNFPDHPGGTDSGWLIFEDGFAAALGAVSIGASVEHMQNQWNGYTFGAAGPPSVTERRPGRQEVSWTVSCSHMTALILGRRAFARR
jgi:hypothetical protein